jgi:hypothetical protein
VSNLAADLSRFLSTAKRATYAAQGDPVSTGPLLEGSKQLEYREGEHLYRDVYVGQLQFVGLEVVYLSGDVEWSMSYAGGLCPGVEPTRAPSIYAHLREALLQVPMGLPLRGPGEYVKGEFRYTCEAHGSIERFHGTEAIRCGSQLLYELHFAGGCVA